MFNLNYNRMVMQKFKKPTKEFKFRYEAPIDLIQFIKLVIKERSIQFDIDSMDCPRGDTFIFKGKLELYEVQELISRIRDSHIMLETVQYIEDYTGERQEVKL